MSTTQIVMKAPTTNRAELAIEMVKHQNALDIVKDLWKQHDKAMNKADKLAIESKVSDITKNTIVPQIAYLNKCLEAIKASN